MRLASLGTAWSWWMGGVWRSKEESMKGELAERKREELLVKNCFLFWSLRSDVGFRERTERTATQRQ